MGTLQSWRRAYGAIKDTTKVGLAHVNSDYAVIPLFPKIGSFFAFDSFWLFGVVLFVLNFRIWTLP